MTSEFPDYRVELAARIASLRVNRPEFRLSRVAVRAGLQRSYLTNVLKGRAHLNRDQLYLVARELALSEAARRRLEQLLELARCAVPARRTELLAQLARIEAKKPKLSRKLSPRTVVLDELALKSYYANPIAPAVHMHLMIPRFRRDPRLIAEVLHVSAEAVQDALDILRASGIISRRGTEIDLHTADLHLDARSDLARIHGTLFRLRAMQALQRRDFQADCFYTVTITADRAAVVKMRERFYEFVKEVGLLAEKAPSEEVFHMNFDLFPV